MGIVPEFLGLAENQSAAGLIAWKDADQTIGNFARHPEQVHRVARTRRTSDLEVITAICGGSQRPLPFNLVGRGEGERVGRVFLIRLGHTGRPPVPRTWRRYGARTCIEHPSVVGNCLSFCIEVGILLHRGVYRILLPSP